MGKFTKHTPEQIVVRLEKADRLTKQGKTTAEICREIGVSEATLSRWRRDYGAMTRSEARELKRLREENSKLKTLLGQSELEKAALKELAEGKF
ncbi:transposase [Corynebacterium accolens]|jgi:ISMyma01 transposase|uniref:transposase n=1 Tax=Corynebacterium accolens TaxID=38284 RepID=UPI001EDA7D08|nr:transposase [Corynebacterium accolens]MDK4209142.1 transposase [Corynebacterium accolens]